MTIKNSPSQARLQNTSLFNLAERLYLLGPLLVWVLKRRQKKLQLKSKHVMIFWHNFVFRVKVPVVVPIDIPPRDIPVRDRILQAKTQNKLYGMIKLG